MSDLMGAFGRFSDWPKVLTRDICKTKYNLITLKIK
jgi:hypothetical protein